MGIYGIGVGNGGGGAGRGNVGEGIGGIGVGVVVEGVGAGEGDSGIVVGDLLFPGRAALLNPFLGFFFFFFFRLLRCLALAAASGLVPLLVGQMRVGSAACAVATAAACFQLMATCPRKVRRSLMPAALRALISLSS